MAARWFSLTLTHCYLIHVCLLFEYRSRNWRSDSCSAIEAWVTTVKAGSQSQPDATLLYESLGVEKAVPTFGLAAVMTLKDWRTQLFYVPYFWTRLLYAKQGVGNFLELFNGNFRYWLRIQWSKTSLGSSSGNWMGALPAEMTGRSVARGDSEWTHSYDFCFNLKPNIDKNCVLVSWGRATFWSKNAAERSIPYREAN